MTDVYKQLEKDTQRVAAYAVSQGDKQIGRVVIAYPKVGGGPLHAYVHIWGTDMVRGTATGTGYDKVTAAVEKAVFKMPKPEDLANKDPIAVGHLTKWSRTLADCKDHEWHRCLEAAGYVVQHVI